MHIDDKPDATGVVLLRRIVEPLPAGQAALIS